MESENLNDTFVQVYNVGDAEAILSQVETVLCIFIQRGFIVAGFNGHKELITIQYKGYANDRIIWDLEFFANTIANEPLLAEHEKVRGVFVLSPKNIIVPNDLYKENHAKVWIKHIHFIESDDFIDTFPIEQDKAVYIMAYPNHIRDLSKNHFPNAKILPLAYYQFLKPPKIGLCLQSCVSSQQVCATLHIDGNLLWHRIFEYASAEDIVFEGKYLCKENNYFATKLTILFNSLTAAEFNVLSDYSQYYPAMKSGEGNRIHTSWDAPTALMQQLLSCVL